MNAFLTIHAPIDPPSPMLDGDACDGESSNGVSVGAPTLEADASGAQRRPPSKLSGPSLPVASVTLVPAASDAEIGK